RLDTRPEWHVGRPVPADRAVTEAAPILLDRASRWYGNGGAGNAGSFGIGPGGARRPGPNGGRKSTDLSIIPGLLPPSTGAVHLFGMPAWRHPEGYRRVGLVPERESVPGWQTGRAFVRYSATLQGLADVDAAATKAIAIVDLSDAADRPIA